MPPVTIQHRAAQIGSEGVSEWVAVTQDMIDRFADATGDRQFIHIDPARAAATPFGGTIAHGFLTLSLMPLLASSTDLPDIAGVRMTVNYGASRLRFLNPVRSGKRVRGRFRLLELIEKKPGQWQQINEVTIEIEGENKPAVIAEWISQIFV